MAEVVLATNATEPDSDLIPSKSGELKWHKNGILIVMITDLDLPPIARTEANYWKAKYFEARAELVKANRGLARLIKKTSALKSIRAENAALKTENEKLKLGHQWRDSLESQHHG